MSDTIVRGRVIGEQGNPDINLQIQIEFIDLTNAFVATHEIDASSRA